MNLKTFIYDYTDYFYDVKISNGDEIICDDIGGDTFYENPLYKPFWTSDYTVNEISVLGTEKITEKRGDEIRYKAKLHIKVSECYPDTNQKRTLFQKKPKKLTIEKFLNNYVQDDIALQIYTTGFDVISENIPKSQFLTDKKYEHLLKYYCSTVAPKKINDIILLQCYICEK